MAKRGRRPKPAAVRSMEGNPGKRPIPDDFVEPEGKLRRPEHVRGYAKSVWERVVRSMPAGVYTATDVGTLTAYCMACELHKTATEMLAIEGHVVTPVTIKVDRHGDEHEVTGKPVRNPWSSILHEAAKDIASLGSQLGLDPISRENIKAPDSKPKSKFGKLVGIDGGKAAG